MGVRCDECGYEHPDVMKGPTEKTCEGCRWNFGHLLCVGCVRMSGNKDNYMPKEAKRRVSP